MRCPTGGEETVTESVV